MPISPEKEHRPEIIERAEEFELPPDFQKAGIRAVETALKARVKDKGRNLIQSPATATISIKLPGDRATISDWSKGKISDSLTWLGLFWLRMLKKAVHFGWKVVRKGKG